MSDLYVLPSNNFLRPNGLGGYFIRQSDLSSYARCQLQKFYEDQGRYVPGAPQRSNLSQTVYGSVLHYTLMVMEQAHNLGDPNALELGMKTFEHYWAYPELLEGVERVDEWLPRQTYGGLRERGRLAVVAMWEIMRKDDASLLALEYQFAVPLPVNGRLHTLTGTVDRLSIRKVNRKPYLSLDDYKTGKQPTYLRFNVQGTAYAYASKHHEFWQGWPDSGMGELDSFDQDTVIRLERSFESNGYRLHDAQDGDLPYAARRFRWINMKEFKFVDGGWRTEQDEARLFMAVDSYVRSCEAGIYSPNHLGEVCRYCEFKNACGGVGLPTEESGRP